MKISLYQFKELVKQEVDLIDLNNFNTQIDKVRRVVKSLESLYQSELLTDLGSDQVLVNVKELKENEYIFQKLLIGGKIDGIRNSFIPEKICREIGLDSGDTVEITDRYDILNNMRLIKKGNDVNKEFVNDFTIYKYCEVKEDGTVLYCDESSYKENQIIKVDGIPFKYVISNDVIEKFKIEPGDFLDIGYENSDWHTLRVVWKYNEETHLTPKPSSYYKEKEEKEINSLYYGIDFEGKKVLVIGCEPRKKYYEDAISYCNGEFLYCSGEEQLDRIYSTIDNADIILLLKDFLSHTVVNKSVDYSKKNDKPFKVVDGLGIKTVVFEARKLLQ